MTNTVDIDQMNDFLTRANEALACDATCQENKKVNALKRDYLQSKLNLVTAPNQVETSFKNYLTYTKGEEAYNEYHNKELALKANTIIHSFKQNFKEDVEKTIELYNTYSGLLINFNNVVELHEKLVKENKILELEVKDKAEDVLTNDRKTYYEDQSIDNLRFYHKIFLILYIIVLIVFIISIFMFQSSLPKPALIGILLVFIIYPFVCSRIFLFLIKIYNLFISVLPKNVYKDI